MKDHELIIHFNGITSQVLLLLLLVHLKLSFTPFKRIDSQNKGNNASGLDLSGIQEVITPLWCRNTPLTPFYSCVPVCVCMFLCVYLRSCCVDAKLRHCIAMYVCVFVSCVPLWVCMWIVWVCPCLGVWVTCVRCATLLSKKVVRMRKNNKQKTEKGKQKTSRKR